MVTQLLFTLFLGLLSGLISLFPAWSLPGSMSGWGAQVGGALSSVAGIFPVVTLGLCLAAVLASWLFIIGFQALVFVYKLIPLKAT